MARITVEDCLKRIPNRFQLVLAATYLLGWITLLAAEFSQLGKHIAGGATFTSTPCGAQPKEGNSAPNSHHAEDMGGRQNFVEEECRQEGRERSVRGDRW